MRRLSEIACNRNPLILAETTSVKSACEKMREADSSSVLVCDEARELVGIFTGRDAVRRVLGVGKGSGKTKLKDVMTKRPVTMAPEKSTIEALRLMWDGGFRHLPLVEDHRIMGLISRNDFAGVERLTLDEEIVMWEHMR